MTDVQPAIPARRSPIQRPGHPVKQRARYASGPSPKVKAAICFMIWGAENGIPLPRKDAAKRAGLADVTLRTALAQPLTLKHYNDQLEVLRTSARATNLHMAQEIRDSAEMKLSASGNRVRIEAARFIEGRDGPPSVNVNVGVQNLMPGYRVDIPSDVTPGARQMLKLAGSHANVLDLQADVPGDDTGTR